MALWHKKAEPYRAYHRENVVDPEGSIINVSRADDEQAITIDPALSSVIKPHQVCAVQGIDVGKSEYDGVCKEMQV